MFDVNPLPEKQLKKYLLMSSAAVVIGALRVNI